MEYTTLSNGVKMPMIGLGTWPLKGTALRSIVSMALDNGYNFFDTATGYGNEEDLGAALKGNETDVFIQSKVNQNTLIGRKRFLYLNKKSMTKAYEASRKKVGVCIIDSYLLHKPFTGCVKHYRELMRLQEAGEVRTVGVCNFDIDELKQLRNHCGVYPEVNQTEISVYNQSSELVDFCQEHNIAVQGYSSFGRGNLVGEILNNNLLKSIASECGRSVGQVVLRWCVQRGIVCITRSTNPRHIKENIDVFSFYLTDSQMQKISTMNSDRVFGVNQIGKRTVSL